MTPRIAILVLMLGAMLSPPALRAAEPVPSRSGSDIYDKFRDGLADPECAPDASSRWRAHFSNAPKGLADARTDVMPLFGYVVDALRDAGLPTEYALIPFVESGYKPGARSPGGPAGMWQMIGITARNHGIRITGDYDGRLSPADSTRAAVRYLKTLHRMFDGNWKLAVMAYNAGENRVRGSLRRSGQAARTADVGKLGGLSGITHAYVRKLHALSCLLDEANDRASWRNAISRQVPLLAAVELPDGTGTLESWAERNGLDAGAVRRLNPAFVGGRVGRSSWGERVLAPRAPGKLALFARDAAPAAEHATLADAVQQGDATRYLVRKGDTPATIAKRHGLSVARLRELNGLDARAAIRPGMALKLRDDAP